jgi:hypothetical protein
MRPVESAPPAEYTKLYPLFDPKAKTLSIRPAAVEVGLVAVVPVGGARYVIVAVNPTLYVEEYVISAVFKVRKEPTAEAWFAAIRERSRFGIAIAAMIRIIATTINSSIREKPLELFFIQSSSGKTLSYHLEISR